MWEYSAPPLWTDQGPMTPDDLGLSADLSERVLAWAREGEAGGGEESSEEEFGRRGLELAREIQEALGPDFVVQYEE